MIRFDNLGEVMGDLSSRRGQNLGSEPDGRLTKIRAMVPEAEMYKYSTQLHSITHGRGTFLAKFSSYQEALPGPLLAVSRDSQAVKGRSVRAALSLLVQLPGRVLGGRCVTAASRGALGGAGTAVGRSRRAVSWSHRASARIRATVAAGSG